MKLCSNRADGFGPTSHLYSHILTSCFLDTILVPLCTWLYLTAIVILLIIGLAGRQSSKARDLGFGNGEPKTAWGKSKLRTGFIILYNFIIVALIAMCSLEIARLSRGDLGIGLLPFTFVSLLLAALLRFSNGFGKRVVGWRWANLGVWISLAVTNSVKIAEEAKEGIHAQEGSKYPESDRLTDVSVMIALYVILAVLEITLLP